MVLLHGVRTGLFLSVGCLLPGWLLGRTCRIPPGLVCAALLPNLVLLLDACGVSVTALHLGTALAALCAPLTFIASHAPTAPPPDTPPLRSARSSIRRRVSTPHSAGIISAAICPARARCNFSPRCPRKISDTEPGPTASRRSWPHSPSGADSPSAKPPTGSPPPSSSARPPSFFQRSGNSPPATIAPPPPSPAPFSPRAACCSGASPRDGQPASPFRRSASSPSPACAATASAFSS